MSTLIEFYSGSGTDHMGRKFHDIILWKDELLEKTHDYIQWLFPNRQASAFNFHAPILTDEDVKHFRGSPFIMENILLSYDRMCRFYKIEEGPPFWWDDLKYSHNWLRMTRIILFLREVGLVYKADEFFEAIYQSKLPNTRTRAFWFDAVGKQVNVKGG